jgi:PEP-CTERM motif
MKKLTLTAVAALLSVSPAAATTIIQTGTITSAVPGTTPIVVQQFNGTLGTLTSITLLFDSNASASGSITNTSGASHTYNLTKSATATLSGNGFNIVESLLSGTTSFSGVAKNATVNFGPYTGAGSSSATLASSFFAPFIGAGSTNLSFVSSSLFSMTPNSGTLSVSPLIGGDYTLTYNYAAAVAAVPEPGSWAMMLLGFGLIGFAARRRQAVKATVAYA